jgi:hypothetical protein
MICRSRKRMICSRMKEVADLKRYSSPTVTPQADGKVGSSRNAACGAARPGFQSQK